jgi:uncharacterized protein (TIGR02996 family)
MTSTIDRRPFLRAIALRPEDPLQLLIYADWLDEHGDVDEAQTMRWRAEFWTWRRGRKLVPVRLLNFPRLWGWCAQRGDGGSGPFATRPNCAVPANLYDGIETNEEYVRESDGERIEYKAFTRWSAAVPALEQAWLWCRRLRKDPAR